jgi:diadenosine tetraphosphate (Ap4A) HIT family hydrolase
VSACVAEGCHVCDAVGARERHLYSDATWFAFSPAEVPGWVMLATREHVQGMWDLSSEQAESLGPLVRAIGGAVVEATGAHRAHLVYLGESALHFHLMFLPRNEQEPPLLDNSPLVAAAQATGDVEAVRAVAARIRGMLAPH